MVHFGSLVLQYSINANVKIHMTDVMEQPHIYTVSELTRNIRIILEDSFPDIWVEGELSNLRTPSSGHIYFTLKDEYAQLPCVLFRMNANTIKFELENGLKVVLSGRITVYERSGQYQLNVENIEPKGLGALQLAFEQLKIKLAREGLFDPAHKRPLPFLPQRVGIVTSPTGAAIRDIMHVLNRRFSNLNIIINPVRVQGDGASREIAKAIEEFNQFTPPCDVLIVTRGGGSLEDLMPFNEEIVARAIYNSKIPVISAIGHEIDYTIADFVADVRAPTPSAAAETVVLKKEDLTKQLRISLERLHLAMRNELESLEDSVKSLASSYALRHPFNLIAQWQQRVDSLGGRLSALSPLSILSRGYSISFLLPEKKLIKDAGILKLNDVVETRVAQGSFRSIVNGRA